MALKIFNKSEKEEIRKKLYEQFGIKEVEGLIIRIGKERLFFYQGSLTQEEIRKIEETIPIERIGVYFGKIQNDKIRLSIEGSHIFKNQITKNTFELSEKDADLWMHGSELLIKTGRRDFLIMKHGEDILGSGKASAEKITNFIPKSRRLKFKNK